MLLLLSAGLRRSEAAAITLDQIDMEHRQLRVRGKGNKERVVPLTGENRSTQSANTWPGADLRRATACSSARCGGSRSPGLASTASCEGCWSGRAWLARASPPHKLRNTLAIHLVRNGVDVRTVQELLGHADLETTANYLHSDTRAKESAVALIATLTGPSPRSRVVHCDTSCAGPRIAGPRSNAIPGALARQQQACAAAVSGMRMTRRQSGHPMRIAAGSRQARHRTERKE